MLLLLASSLLWAQSNGRLVDPCDRGRLPANIQKQLNADLGEWMIQTGSNLGPYAREGWAATKPAKCPGFEPGKFEHTNEISYAILLVRNTPSDQAYKLVVFSRAGNRADFRMRLLDEGDHGAHDYYLRKLPLSYFSRESRKKFSMEGAEIILITESGENEAGSEIYYWSGGRYKSDPIDL